MTHSTAEHQRLVDYRRRASNWKQWGPYLSERAWGTVREDYSPNGAAWDYFPHDHARSRAYRWNEDGLAGICDRHQHVCFALALWNGNDPILKERLFGLTGPEGNHGEDVKEYYFYIDSTPTHSYMSMLYKYPQREFPYRELVAENQRRSVSEREFELIDTGVFAEDRYFDVLVEYGKAAEQDLLVRVRVTNHGPDPARCVLLPTLWFRNTWSWGYESGPMGDVAGKPIIKELTTPGRIRGLEAWHPAAGMYSLYADGAAGLLFTENETNAGRLFGVSNGTEFVKDAFHRYFVNRDEAAVNPNQQGTKAAFVFDAEIGSGEARSFRLHLSRSPTDAPFERFDDTLEQRRAEADEFYDAIQNPRLDDDARRVQRQAFAGMLWSKQLYYYDVEQWLKGAPGQPAPPPSRRTGRNREWQHLTNFDVISMPDKWEYPWYATWDLAFHCIPLVLVDPDLAKRQLELITREWYMHPNGALPAYEWAFGDVNPPVHAWAAWRVYKIDGRQHGKMDTAFLKGIFHKLLLNFTWWVNKKDEGGNNVFQGGFLGLDNISLFDRSATLPTGGHIDQSDGTAGMAFYSLEMMKIALELAREDPVYQDMATKFFEHFLSIARAMTDRGSHGHALWDERDGFFYDALHVPDGTVRTLRVRSLVGLMPLLAVETLEAGLLETMPDFERRMHWFLANRPHLAGNIASVDVPGAKQRHLTAIVSRDQLISVLRYMLDENEFLSPYGIRSLSKAHAGKPYSVTLGGETFAIGYQPGESKGGLFGGNSNWRGPVWFPINYLLIEALQRFHHYYGDGLRVECPTGSGYMASLDEVARDLSIRLTRLFLLDSNGRRPIYGDRERFQGDPHWRDWLLFNEYFHGESGAGLGASHQTGWTGLVAKLIQQSGGTMNEGQVALP